VIAVYVGGGGGVREPIKGLNTCQTVLLHAKTRVATIVDRREGTSMGVESSLLICCVYMLCLDAHGGERIGLVEMEAEG